MAPTVPLHNFFPGLTVKNKTNKDESELAIVP